MEQQWKYNEYLFIADGVMNVVVVVVLLFYIVCKGRFRDQSLSILSQMVFLLSRSVFMIAFGVTTKLGYASFTDELFWALFMWSTCLIFAQFWLYNATYLKAAIYFDYAFRTDPEGVRAARRRQLRTNILLWAFILVEAGITVASVHIFTKSRQDPTVRPKAFDTFYAVQSSLAWLLLLYLIVRSLRYIRAKIKELQNFTIAENTNFFRLHYVLFTLLALISIVEVNRYLWSFIIFYMAEVTKDDVPPFVDALSQLVKGVWEATILTTVKLSFLWLCDIVMLSFFFKQVRPFDRAQMTTFMRVFDKVLLDDEADTISHDSNVLEEEELLAEKEHEEALSGIVKGVLRAIVAFTDSAKTQEFLDAKTVTGTNTPNMGQSREVNETLSVDSGDIKTSTFNDMRKKAKQG